jgi:transaldolase
MNNQHQERKMPSIDDLKVKLFCDGADFDSILSMYKKTYIKGFTTNPTLMRKAGIADYEAFGRKLLAAVPDRPVSLEVFADDLENMEIQANKIASWGPNVNIKIPITNTRGEFTGPLIKTLSSKGVVLNITAIMTVKQVEDVAACLDSHTASIISVFAGRIADTGVDPVPLMADCLKALKEQPRAELLWASPRELLNVFQASDVGCHIITATPDILAKLKLVNKDLTEYSLDTVKMFHTDASSAGYSI